MLTSELIKQVALDTGADACGIAGGMPIDVPDFGNPPADWEVLDWKTGK